jgi:two-component system, OmpR family, response regulator MprA
MRTKILVVDDDPDLLLLLRVTLAAEDFQSLLARNGEDAIREIQTESPHLVLLDIMMPVMDGWQVLRWMTDKGIQIPVIVVSAKASETDVAKALELGAIDYVTKPFDPDQLLQSILAALGRSPEDRNRRRAERLAALSSGRA